MDPVTYHLFVYGSLRSGFRNPAYAYLTKYFHLKGEALVRGKVFDNGYPVAVPDSKDSFISGELYEFNNPDEFAWVIAQLDDYEGLNVEEGQLPLYKRAIADAFQNGVATKAWIYWFNGSVAGMKEISPGDLMKFLQEKNKP
ncbi:MAG TPA: gamma-glutamylcyclotransferase family protein [Ferruginibacter sp.]|nr:gamma-glutamylcyclotransferase family protein [Ferruginibacter sp.]